VNIQDIITKSYQILRTNELYDCRIDEILCKGMKMKQLVIKY